MEVALLTTQNTRLSAASAPKAYSQAVYATLHEVRTSTVLTTVVDFTPLSIAEFASAYRALWMSLNFYSLCFRVKTQGWSASTLTGEVILCLWFQ